MKKTEYEKTECEKRLDECEEKIEELEKIIAKVSESFLIHQQESKYENKDLESKIANLLTSFKELKQGISNDLANYREKAWSQVDKLWKIVIFLILVITLFAGIKITGLLDYVGKIL
jgi:hypothetical protein